MATKKRRDSVGLFYELNHNEGKNIPMTISRTVDYLNQPFITSWQDLMSVKMWITNPDMAPILKMFDHLKGKIMKADQHGLRSLTKK